ncbi:MAG: hypothetical protein HY744_04735 [Deltaproteobacteria bacterium]|nr:hypothetical protein [Deltaproteobacteria bacterium]
MLSRKIQTFYVALALGLLPPALLLSASCGGDDKTDISQPPSSSGGGSTSTSSSSSSSTSGGEGVCLLNNCKSDEHCKGCSEGRTTCKLDENRCVACDPTKPEGQQGCKDGEKCSSWGVCVPKDLSCETDKDGNPTVKCAANADCMACDPMHQVCDTKTGKCQACTDTNTSHCLQSDICLNGKCSPKCPKSCNIDNDCKNCGAPGNKANGCFQHKCSQCSDTWKCELGMECVNGVCVPPCGIPGPVAGTCTNKEDCMYCGDPKAPVKWDCKKPLNANKPEDHGNCMPPAEGCSDLGNKVVVLPPPYSNYTQLCSVDNDCKNIGLQYNVGKAIRDLVGADELNLGFAKVKIHDANVLYPMPYCAVVFEVKDKKCGVCVPCKEDGDCQPIPVDPLFSDLFKGEPLAQIAAAVLIDLLYGDEEAHNLNFWCQPVVAGYGVCIPCGNPLQKCGKSGGGGSGKCPPNAHNVCEKGDKLDPSCGECAKAVCEQDSYCCDTEWDQTCVAEVDKFCSSPCGGGGGGCHSPCQQGDAMKPGCSACVEAVCKADGYCCSGKWDDICVGEAKAEPKCASECAGGCAHSPCSEGAKLPSNCKPGCTDKVCGDDPFCCDTEWDKYCVDGAKKAGTCGC